MDKLQMQSKNLVDENIEKIAKLFPNCMTEGKDENGQVVRLVDFDLLKQELSKDIIEGNDERYTLNWAGKKQAILTANSPINATLRPCREESVDFDNTKNLYIEGDNLDVLKLLRETYLGKVKMIYIDPPYNTGNDFVYEDDFATSTEEYLQASKSYDEQGNKMFQNNESNGRFHSDWLSMMYSRLKVAKDLLSDDGAIFISIDDNEQENLKKLCNEIFGENNFIATFKWNRVAKAPSLSGMVRTKYEYVLAYYKNIKPQLFGKQSYNTQGPLWHLPNKRAELTFPEKSIRVKSSFKAQVYGGSYQVELLDDLVCENGLNKFPIRVLACSAWGQNKINEYVAKGNTFEIKTNPQTFYTDLDSQNNFIAPSDLISMEECGVKRNTDANDELNKLDIPFDYSKPTSLIQYLTNIVTYTDKSAMILDFFSGSATTAHAIMQLNANDGGNRKFIMVQLPEITDENSEAYKAGYKTICEIGKERIRRAGKKIKEENPNATDLDIGFRDLKLDSSCMKDIYYSPNKTTQDLLTQFEDNIKEDRTPEDLLFQVMLDMGVLLSSEIKTLEINGKKVFNVNDGDLVCCFDKDLNETTVTAIAKMQPLYAVFRDASMSTDSVAVNFDQIFETYSPTTTRKII